ncbi:MAG: acyl-CoA dehydrogenase, partial [Chloroflexota bacterium]
VEPNVQYDPSALKTTAELVGGEYKLDGVKSFVPLANTAETLLIFAAEEGTTQAFLVPRDTPGLTVGEQEKQMGMDALATYTVTLEDCTIPQQNKLGGDQGCDIELILTHARVASSAMAVGVARASYEFARNYALEREAFGEPIASRQAIAFMLAEMAIDIDAARLMVWEAAWRLDQGLEANKEAYLAKVFADEMVVRVTDGGVQVLGGYGYIREFPVELWLRNGRGFAALTGIAMV